MLLTVGIALEELRLDEALPDVLHVFVLAGAATLVLGLGVQAQLESRAEDELTVAPPSPRRGGPPGR